MRQRLIRPGFFTNEVLGSLPPLTRILFAGLWCAADREGRLEDRPSRLKALLLPYDDYDVAAGLADLDGHGFIVRYEIDGEKYIQITKFDKNQWPHHKEQQSVIPKPKASPRQAQGTRGKPKTSPILAHPLTGSTVNGIYCEPLTGSTGPTVLPPNGGMAASESLAREPGGASAVLAVPVKAKAWSAEACEDWSEASGGVAPGGKIGAALKPLIAKVAREKGLDDAEAWGLIRPFWRKFCESDNRKFGPASFAQNPKQVMPKPGLMDDLIRRVAEEDARERSGQA